MRTTERIIVLDFRWGCGVITTMTRASASDQSAGLSRTALLCKSAHANTYVARRRAAGIIPAFAQSCLHDTTRIAASPQFESITLHRVGQGRALVCIRRRSTLAEALQQADLIIRQGPKIATRCAVRYGLIWCAGRVVYVFRSTLEIVV